jgi:hypothetical protein
MFSDLIYRLRALFRRKAVDRELEENCSITWIARRKNTARSRLRRTRQCVARNLHSAERNKSRNNEMDRWPPNR